jgi:hypothetical protein
MNGFGSRMSYTVALEYDGPSLAQVQQSGTCETPRVK